MENIAMRKKSISGWAVFFCSIFSLTAPAKEVRINEKTFFPIVGFNFLWRADEKQVSEQADMGLTLITMNSPEELDWCGKYGMRGIYYNPQYNRFLAAPDAPDLKKFIAEDLARVRNHRALYGIQVSDEPSRRVFAGYSRILEAISQTVGKMPIYTNMFPDYSQPYQHGYDTYGDYVAAFSGLLKKYPPSPYVYDNYSNKNTVLRPEEGLGAYLQNLATVREITLKQGIPFWVTAICSAHDLYAEPGEADINVEVFSALAHGARGIGYFSTTSHVGMIFQGGPFDALGEKTSLWRVIRDCNYRVRTLAPILLTLQSTGVFYSLTAHDKVLMNKSFPCLPGRLVKSLKCANERSSLLVGEFKAENGADWIMVVNLNLQTACRFLCELQNGSALQAYNSYTGTPVTSDTFLRPGQGKLYKIMPADQK